MDTNLIDLRGKTALVTGGSRGIGAAAARLLAQAGASVAITYATHRTSAEAVARTIRNQGGDCVILRCAAARRSAISAAVRRVVRTYGSIDILVVNAGIWKRGSIGSMSERQWDETLDINLKSAFLFCDETVPIMKRAGRGKIVTVASTAGQRGEPHHSHYAASKAGLIGFTRAIGAELAPYHIIVNCVAPGWVDTDMSAGVLRNGAQRRAIEKTIPRGRVASAKDIAGPILFLASDLSDHMVGSVISVNGGSVMA